MAKELTKLNVMLDEGAHIPVRAHDEDAGMDLQCRVGGCVAPHNRHFFDTGIHVEIPKGYVGFIKSKSGLMKKCGLITDGTVDAGYSGSIGVTIINTSDEPHIFYAGDKIAQLVIQPVSLCQPVLVEKMAETERGNNGFGSTGK